MRRLENLAHWLHERVLDGNCDIGTRIPLGCPRKLAVVLRFESRVGVADGELKHGRPGSQVREGDVYSPLEAAADGGVELPRDVGGAQDEHALAVLAHAVHLHQHLGLYPPRGLRLALAAGPAQGVDLVDEDDGGLVLAGHGEELLHETVLSDEI